MKHTLKGLLFGGLFIGCGVLVSVALTAACNLANRHYVRTHDCRLSWSSKAAHSVAFGMKIGTPATNNYVCAGDVYVEVDGMPVEGVQ